jgi:cob(I)alamin adenosyltransferase
MGYRLSKIYTRSGDSGETGLADGSRTSKASTRIAAIGDIDELNSMLAVLLVEGDFNESLRALLIDIQHSLFNLGGELAKPGASTLQADEITALESHIDRYNHALPPLREFVLPGGGRSAALCHLARSVCRRAERSLTTLNAEQTTNPASLMFLNRLSDLLFVVARVLARSTGNKEMLWEPGRTVKESVRD